MNSSSLSRVRTSAMLSLVFALVGVGLALGSIAVDTSAVKVLVLVAAMLSIATSGAFLGVVLRNRPTPTTGR